MKERDLGVIKELLTKHVRKGYLIGECACQMRDAWREAIPCEVCETIDRAVARAADEAVAGEAVLLSPGTASFDQFRSYKERGERFAQAARQVAVSAERTASRTEDMR